MKRKIFIMISSLLNLSSLGMIFIDGPAVLGIIGALLLMITLDFFAQMFFVLKASKNGTKVPDLYDHITFFSGIYTIRFKKIIYLDIGDFYALKWGDTIRVYEQNWLTLDKIVEVAWTDNIELVKTRILTSLNETIGKRLEEEAKKKRNKEVYKNWNGTLDKRSNRDKVIEDILN